MNIRPYHPTDMTALYRICLKTGNSGKDATSLFKDPDLLGHIYAAPYAYYESELCFIATKDGTPCGYILGTKDSEKFYKRLDQEWLPPLRVRCPLPGISDNSLSARIARLIHQEVKLIEEVKAYPAHLHINLLPIAQGQGMGRRLMDTFLEKLISLSVPAVHLGVGKSNTGAISFYEKLGFQRLKEEEKAIIFGKRF
jgi:ribosomal protein S18 acetylase RimI-like enzyme